MSGSFDQRAGTNLSQKLWQRAELMRPYWKASPNLELNSVGSGRLLLVADEGGFWRLF